jgi:hypothetical protein
MVSPPDLLDCRRSSWIPLTDLVWPSKKRWIFGDFAALPKDIIQQ